MCGRRQVERIYNRRRLVQTSRAGTSSRANPPRALLCSGATMLQLSLSLKWSPPVTVLAADLVGETALVAVRPADVVGETVAEPRLGVLVGVFPDDPPVLVGVAVPAPDVLVGVCTRDPLGVAVGV